jgi:hypothetical protein
MMYVNVAGNSATPEAIGVCCAMKSCRNVGPNLHGHNKFNEFPGDVSEEETASARFQQACMPGRSLLLGNRILSKRLLSPTLAMSVAIIRTSLWGCVEDNTYKNCPLSPWMKGKPIYPKSGDDVMSNNKECCS